MLAGGITALEKIRQCLFPRTFSLDEAGQNRSSLMDSQALGSFRGSGEEVPKDLLSAFPKKPLGSKARHLLCGAFSGNRVPTPSSAPGRREKTKAERCVQRSPLWGAQPLHIDGISGPTVVHPGQQQQDTRPRVAVEPSPSPEPMRLLW